MYVMLDITRVMPASGLSSAQCAALAAAGDWFAAGFLAGDDLSVPERMANGALRAFACTPLAPYAGDLFYPHAHIPWAAPDALLHWHYVAPVVAMPMERQARIAATADPLLREAYLGVDAFFTNFMRGQERPDHPGHGMAGAGWTHSTLQYARILAEGLDGYGARIEAAVLRNTGAEAQALYRGLRGMLDAITLLAARMAGYLESLSFDDAAAEARRLFHIRHLREGINRPAETFVEAITTTAFICVLDGCDSLGRIDQFLWLYYQRDIECGRINEGDARAMLRALWQIVDDANGWNVTLGGTTRDGQPAANELTRLCLEAARGMRRPNLALRLRDDTPDVVWTAALETIRAGTGIPALYSETNYLLAIDATHLGVPPEDARDYAFGGCTELMIQGASNVGSLDYDLNVAKIFADALQAHLADCATFETVYVAFLAAYRREVRVMVDRVNQQQRWRAGHAPQLIRTLFTDDCIASGRNFQDGGARYNWSIINLGGVSNVIDSLAAIREVVYETGDASPAELRAALAADFDGFAALRARLLRCPRFGNDHVEVDALAHRLSGDLFNELSLYAPWRGGKFLASTLMFVTYGAAGACVGATPDGRRAGEALADSAGPVQGRDRCGPTAMLRSVTRLQQHAAPGTLVVNMRLSPTLFATADGRAKIMALIRSYFALGGMQLQINVVDQAVLRDAVAHPERHGNLVIRMGGYSEYFTRLDATLQHTVLERTEHE